MTQCTAKGSSAASGFRRRRQPSNPREWSLRNDLNGGEWSLRNDLSGREWSLRNDLSGREWSLRNDLSGREWSLRNDLSGREWSLRNDPDRLVVCPIRLVLIAILCCASLSGSLQLVWRPSSPFSWFPRSRTNSRHCGFI